MRNASTEFNQYVSSGGLFYMNADVTFANGTRMHLDKKDFYISGNNFTDGAGANSLPVGVAMAKTVQMCLVNDDDRFSECDFFHAKFTIYAYAENVGESKLVESVKIGTFTVITPENYGNKITVTAVDDMYKADVEYTSNMLFPRSIKSILLESTNSLGIKLSEKDIPNPDYWIDKKPEGITHRQLYGLVAMMIGGNAKISSGGYLKFIGYDKNFLSEKMLDGGNLEYYISGDNADGGSFSNYNSGDSIDGGNFDSLKDYHSFSSAMSPKISTDDVIITGVRVLVDGESYLYGSEGYVIELSNDLIAEDTENVIKSIGTALVGLRFRPFELENISNPLVEFGDSCYISDIKGNMYKSIITDVEFEWLGKTNVKCSAEPPLRNSSKYLSETAKQIAQVKKETNKAIDDINDINDDINDINNDINEISGNIDDIEKEQGVLSSKITTAEGLITAEATRAQGAENTLSGRIDILPENITLSVSDAKGSASISIKIDYADGTSKTQTRTIDLDADTINLTANDIINLIADNTINLTADNIQIDSTNFSVDETGEITANSGTIGGWNINSDYLSSGTGNTFAGMSANSGRYAFWAGQDDGTITSEAPFRVGHDGNLFASKIHATGTFSTETKEGVSVYVAGNGISYVANDDLIADITVANDGLLEIATANNIFLLPSVGVKVSGIITATSVHGALYATDKKSTSQAPNGYVNIETGHVAYSTGSAKRFKNSIDTEICEELDPKRLYDVPVVQYKYNTDYLSNEEDIRYDKEVIGFIADELLEVYPIACDYSVDDNGEVRAEDWNFRYMIPPMLKLIQEQHKEIEKLKETVNKLVEKVGV